jgi:thioredoxin-related protein
LDSYVQKSKNRLMKKLILVILAVFLLSCERSIQAQDTPLDNLNWQEMERALELASEHDKLILIDVFAQWCPYCQRMQSEVYPSDEVEEVVNKYFIPVRIDTESDEALSYHGNDFTQAEFAVALQYRSVPTTYFMNANGEVLGQQPGFLPVDVFTQLLEYVGSGAHETQTFDEFNNDSDR